MLARSIARFLAVAAVVAAGLTPHLARAASTDSVAWQEFAANKLPSARAQFLADVKANPNDADAYRGLGWIDYTADDQAGALSNWSRSIVLDPDQWQAMGLWGMMADIEATDGDQAALVRAAQAIVGSGQPEEMKAAAHLALADAADNQGTSAQASSIRCSLGNVTDWMVCGPFDNVSKSGFDKAFDPEHGVNLYAAMIGKDDLRRMWHRLKVVDRDGDCPVSSALSTGGAEEAFYATTGVYSAAPRSVRIEFQPTGATKLFLDGRLLQADPVYRTSYDTDVVPFSISAQLTAGWNTLLIKDCSIDAVDADFQLRFLDESGHPLLPSGSFKVDALHAEGGPVQQPSAGPTPAVETVFAALNAHPADLEAALLLAWGYDKAWDYDNGEAYARGAVATFPNNGLLHQLFAVMLDDDAQEDEATAEREQALALNTELAESRIKKAQTDNNGAPAQLVASLQALCRAFPRSVDAVEALSGAYDEAGLKAQSIQEARLAIRLGPGDADYTSLVDTLTNDERDTEAITTLRTALKTTPADPALLTKLADQLTAPDQAAEAIALYRKLLLLAPYTPSYLDSIAQIEIEQGRLADAEVELKLEAAAQPQSSEVWSELGDLYSQRMQKSQAIVAYREAVALDPGAVQLRDKVDVLSGQKPVLDLVAPLPTPSLAAKAPEGAATASREVLVDDGRRVVYPDGASLAWYHQVIRVNDDAAARQMQTYYFDKELSTDTATVEKAIVTKADGKIEDHTSDAGDDSVDFPSLAAGDTIDVAYRIQSYERGALAGRFWGDWIFTSYDDAVTTSRYALITPVSMDYAVQEHNGAPAPTERTAGIWRIREWRVDSPPVVSRPFAGLPEFDALPWIDVSNVGSWKDIIDWYTALASPRCVPDPAVRAKAAQLTKGCATDDAKIHAIVAYVRKLQYQSTPFRMSAYIPTEGKEVIRERYGDCKDKAALIVSLLAAVDIPAHMVLLSPREYGDVSYLPSPRFAHAIARIELPAGPVWVDGTASELAYGKLPIQDEGVPALVIDSGTSDLQTIPVTPPQLDGEMDTIQASVDATGRMTGSAQAVCIGNDCWTLRQVFDMVPSDKRPEVMRLLLGKLIKSAVYDFGTWSSLDAVDDPMTLNLVFHADTWATPAGDFLLTPIPWFRSDDDGLLNAIQPGRTQDLDMEALRGERDGTVTLTLPAGYSLQTLPADAHAATSWGTYDFTYRQNGSTITASRKFLFSALRIAAPDIPQFVQFVQAFDKQVSQPLVLKKAS